MDNALAIHSFIWSSPWNMKDGCYAIERAAALGFDIIAIPLRDMSVINPDIVVKVLQANGIKARAALSLSPETDISSTDPDIARKGEARLKQALAMARDIGAEQMGGVIYAALSRYMSAPTREGRMRSIEILAKCAEVAKADGIVLTLEPANRYETNLINTAQQGVTLINEIGTDNIMLHLDTFHMNIEEEDTATAIEIAGSKLGFFELSESNRGYLGKGSINFSPMFKTLAKIGYQGPIGFEAFTSNRARPSFAAIMALWRPVWEDADDIAIRAHQFIRAQLAAARTQSPT